MGSKEAAFGDMRACLSAVKNDPEMDRLMRQERDSCYKDILELGSEAVTESANGSSLCERESRAAGTRE